MLFPSRLFIYRLDIAALFAWVHRRPGLRVHIGLRQEELRQPFAPGSRNHRLRHGVHDEARHREVRLRYRLGDRGLGGRISDASKDVCINNATSRAKNRAGQSDRCRLGGSVDSAG